MNLEHLALFARVAVTNNISQAGKEQGLSPAVASAYISKLEQSLGVRLVHRTTRRVSLTEEGHTFLPHAQAVLEGVDNAKAAVGAGSVNPSGKLRVTAPASFGRMHLLPALQEFLQRYPDVNVDMHLSDSIVDLVEGGFDLAIRDAVLQDSTLVARKLAEDRRILCASAQYLAAKGVPKHPDDLKAHHCVNLMGLETWHFVTPQGVQHVKTRNRFRTDNGEAARDAAAGGAGITLTSTWCSYQHVQRRELVQVLEDYPIQSEAAIWAVYPSARLVPPKVRVFIDYLSARFSGEPYWEQSFESEASAESAVPSITNAL